VDLKNAVGISIIYKDEYKVKAEKAHLWACLESKPFFIFTATN
jgi:hypothetical protein